MRVLTLVALLLMEPAGSFMSTNPSQRPRQHVGSLEVATRPPSDRVANDAQQFNLNVGSA
eukprot:CAMPEP_0205936884 /NCGR_PEP_ID=MMETSP1325-20131115/42640_1 /ASSEMBLY_ACC=CAM_ASM_000708 /TAXON_ID=236786 /ORGANISM="Florenciella sp., Strain RCC1007" /LENGTH=59 /DNA_ID=CAMNT_0053307089 /DNA_START=54 /DNA_END=230 /DNA_ORIENTATION=-